ncbi:MAG: GDSL family lipase [Ruminococcaceae bacterium]|nr:GDSL family lipase [Oscillospiraceae bacterium]
MKIINKIEKKASNIREYPVPTIVFLGDSVTQGCYELNVKSDDSVSVVFDKINVYHSYVQRIFNILFPKCPLNIINAGISGGKSHQACERLSRDVLCYNPDLTVVCFGLNDCGNISVEEYSDSLKTIFTQAKAIGSEVIYMTPNMMNTSVSGFIKEKPILDIAQKSADKQNNLMDEYIKQGMKTAEECGVKICDCYSLWKKLNESGVNTDELLANYINHPIREMHWLFAYKLVETMFSE